MNVIPIPHRVLATLAAAVVLLSGCQEDLGGGTACPSLCPEQQLIIHDTTLVGAQLLDLGVTVPGIPPLGTEPQVVVADYVRRGDTLRTFGVLRFDSLQRALLPPDTTQPGIPFVRVDSAGVFVNGLAPPTGQDTLFATDTVTLEVYDVDADAPDLDTAAVHAKFLTSPIASRSFPQDSLTGVLKVNLDTGFVARHIRTGQRIRLGLRARSKANVQLRFVSAEGVAASGVLASSLRYFAYTANDSAKVFVTNPTASRSPEGPRFNALQDWTLVDRGSPPAPPGLLVAGGMPSNRIFLRFDLPAALVDSSTTVVKADLILHQAPDSNYLDPADSITLTPRAVVASPDVIDVTKAVMLVADNTTLPLRAVLTDPAGHGVLTVPLASITGTLIAFWRTQGPTHVQRAIALTSDLEAIDPRQLRYYSDAAPVESLRPRMRIVFVPRSGFGLP